MTATLAHERIEVEDTAVAALRFKNGALGVIEAATSAYPGPAEADRDPRRPRLGPGRAGRHHALGLPGEGPQRQRGLRRHGRPDRLQGRRQRPARHHPHRPPRPARRLPPGDRRRAAPRSSTAARAASRSRSSGPSTDRPDRAGREAAARTPSRSAGSSANVGDESGYNRRAGHAHVERSASEVNGVTAMPRHKIRRPWLDYLVYLAVRLVVAFAQMLTIEQSYALARFLAWVMYQVDRAAPAGRAREPDDGLRRPLRRGRARPDRPRGLSPLLHDAHGDPAHPAEAPPDQLAAVRRGWSATSRCSTG